MPWRLPDSPADRLALAKGYPFPAPGSCYLFRNGTAEPLPRDPALYEGRQPVLAHGSNRSPEQLARKYGSAAEIPVTYGRLADYDVVYSAHMSQYGSIASTLQHTPGTTVRLTINWLDRRQLARMHETEGPSTYAYGRLRGIDLALESGPVERPRGGDGLPLDQRLPGRRAGRQRADRPAAPWRRTDAGTRPWRSPRSWPWCKPGTGRIRPWTT